MINKNMFSTGWEKFREHARRADRGQSRVTRHDPLVNLSNAVEKVLNDAQEYTLKKDKE